MNQPRREVLTFPTDLMYFFFFPLIKAIQDADEEVEGGDMLMYL